MYGLAAFILVLVLQSVGAVLELDTYNTSKLVTLETFVTKMSEEIFDKSRALCYIHDNDVVKKDQVSIRPALKMTVQILSVSSLNRDRNLDIRCHAYLIKVSNWVDVVELKLNANKKMLIIVDNIDHQYKVPVIVGAQIFIIQVKEFKDYQMLKLQAADTKQILASWNTIKRQCCEVNQSKLRNYLNHFRPIVYNKTAFIFKVAATSCAPFTYLSGTELKGLEITVLKEILKTYKTTYLYSTSNFEDKWALLRTMIARKEADMAGCSQYMAEAFSSLDVVYWPIQICETFLVPKPYLDRGSVLTQPFGSRLWLSTFGMTMWASIMYFLAVRYILKRTNVSLGSVLFNFFKMLLLISISMKRRFMKKSSFRIFLITWLYRCLLLSVYYNAGLSSFMTRPKLFNVIDTISDLTKSDINCYVPNIEYWLSHSSSDKLRKMWKKDARNKTNLEKDALIVKKIEWYVADTEGFNESQLVYSKVISDCLNKEYIGFILQKHSPFTRHFQDVTNKLYEAGILLKWLNMEIQDSYLLQRKFFSFYVQENKVWFLNFEGLIGAFYILSIGFTVSLVVFLLEIGSQRPGKISTLVKLLKSMYHFLHQYDA